MTRVELGSILSLDKGVSYSGKYLTEDGPPMVNLKCIERGGGFRSDGLKPYSGPVKPKHRIEGGGIVMANTDLTQAGNVIGAPARVPVDLMGAVISHHLFAVRVDSEVAHPRFVYYYLKSEPFRAFARSVASGTTVLGLRADDVLGHLIDLPPMTLQRKIAAVLAAYDELIENNLRRVELLEEMAQTVYREWFDELRFPGHEATDFVQSPFGPVPDAWTIEEVGHHVSRLAAGRTYKAADVADEGDVVVVDQSRQRLLGFHCDEPAHVACPDEPKAIFGDHTCKMELLLRSFSVGPNVIPFESSSGRSLYYVYFAIKDLVDTAEYKRHWTTLVSKQRMWCTPELSEVFAGTVTPMFQLIELLERQNRGLRSSRDLLLPGLVSGDLDVSELDIDMEWLVA